VPDEEGGSLKARHATYIGSPNSFRLHFADFAMLANGGTISSFQEFVDWLESEANGGFLRPPVNYDPLKSFQVRQLCPGRFMPPCRCASDSSSPALRSRTTTTPLLEQKFQSKRV
jgi:hypothetical protein